MAAQPPTTSPQTNLLSQCLRQLQAKSAQADWSDDSKGLLVGLQDAIQAIANGNLSAADQEQALYAFLAHAHDNLNQTDDPHIAELKRWTRGALNVCKRQIPPGIQAEAMLTHLTALLQTQTHPFLQSLYQQITQSKATANRLDVTTLTQELTQLRQHNEQFQKQWAYNQAINPCLQAWKFGQFIRLMHHNKQNQEVQLLLQSTKTPADNSAPYILLIQNTVNKLARDTDPNWQKGKLTQAKRDILAGVLLFVKESLQGAQTPQQKRLLTEIDVYAKQFVTDPSTAKKAFQEFAKNEHLDISHDEILAKARGEVTQKPAAPEADLTKPG